MNWPWQSNEPEDDDEDEQRAPVAVAPRPGAAERRAARLANQPAPPAIGDWTAMEQPESGERFERWLISTMHQAGPILITLLIGASVGYFMSDFATSLTLTSAIGYGGGFTVSLIECALVYKKRLASRAGDDEQARWLLLASLGFGFASIVTQIVFLQIFLSNHLADTSVLESIPLLGVVVGIMGGSTFFVIVRASLYHGALYASAWLLSGSKPSLIKQLEWEEKMLLHQRARVRFQRTISEDAAPTIAAPREGKDLLALIQQMQQQLTEMQVRQQTITGQYKTVSVESEAAPDGDTTFQS